MLEIMLNEIEKVYGGSKVLQGATFSVLAGERVGLVGGNGAGKTTLLKILAGLESYDGGNLSIRKGASLGYLDQLPEIPANSKVSAVLHMAFAEQFELFRSMQELAKQMETLKGDAPEYGTLLPKYGSLQQLYEQKGGFNIEEKVEKVCQGLKLSAPFLDREFQDLSGGEKTRVILGRILLENPDILLLDEPTNHLDLDSLEWLEDFIAKYKGTVVVVSHDRYFLDKAVSKIIEVENGKTEIYNTAYSGFCREKEKRTQELLKKHAQQENEIKRLEKAAHNLREWGKIADNPDLHKRAENIEKRIEKMDKVEKPALGENYFPLAFTNPGSRSADVIRAENLAKRFGEKTLFTHLNLHIRYREKVALLGANGTGKSTLLKILLREYGPDCGEVAIGPGTKPAYIAQTIAFAGRDNTVLEEFRNSSQVTEGQARKALAKFSFKGEEVFKKVQNLSGGEKSRLRLCLLMQQDVNFLILDEPTNHLDIPAREVLEKALLEFAGTILFTSHDRYFINRIAGRIIELQNGELRNYPGNYEHYKEKKAREQLQAFRAEKPGAPKREKHRSNMTAGCGEAIREKRHSELENQINRLELRIKEKAGEMDDCSSDFNRLAELYAERSALERELDSLLAEWLDIKD